MTRDKSKEHWLTTLILQIKINSVPYVLKTIIFIAIVVIIHVFSDSQIAKILSVITYTAGICIDAYFLSNQCFTDSERIEVFLFIHECLVWAGTIASIILLIKISIDTSFVKDDIYKHFDRLVDLFLIYSTMTPLLEAIMNCNSNQATRKVTKEVEGKA